MTKRLSLAVAALAAAFFAAAVPAQAVQHFYAFTMNGPSENPPNASLGNGTGLAIYDDVAGTLQLSATFAGLQAGVTQTHFHGVTTVSGLPDNNPIGETPNQAAAAVPNQSIAVGAPSLPGFPLGVTNGVYANTLDLNDPSIYNAGFLAAQGGTAAGARAAFVGSLASGRTYWNIHTAAPNGFPPGEIRGFPVLIPEPATLGLATMAIGLLVVRHRRK